MRKNMVKMAHNKNSIAVYYCQQINIYGHMICTCEDDLKRAKNIVKKWQIIFFIKTEQLNRFYF